MKKLLVIAAIVAALVVPGVVQASDFTSRTPCRAFGKVILVQAGAPTWFTRSCRVF